MPIDYIAMKAEIEDDPLSMGYSEFVNTGNDIGICNLMNSTSGVGAGSKVVPLPILTVLQFVSGRGIRTNIEDCAQATGVAYRGIKSLCLGFIDMVWGVGTNRVFDITDPAISGDAGFLDAFIQGGVMNSQDKSDLISLGIYPASRAETLFGSDTIAYTSDVSYALRGTR